MQNSAAMFTVSVLNQKYPFGRFHRCRTGQSEVNFLLKYVSNVEDDFFDGYIWTFFSDLKHNSHKENK